VFSLTAIIIEIDNDYTFVIDKDGIVHKIDNDSSFRVGQEIDLKNVRMYHKAAHAFSGGVNPLWLRQFKRVVLVAATCALLGMMIAMTMMLSQTDSGTAEQPLIPTEYSEYDEYDELGEDEIIIDGLDDIPLGLPPFEASGGNSSSAKMAFYMLTGCFAFLTAAYLFLFYLGKYKKAKLKETM